jgi:DNA-binding MarR family transcriptional regulator
VSDEDARITMLALTRRGEQRLQTVLPLLDDLRKTAPKGIPKSENKTWSAFPELQRKRSRRLRPEQLENRRVLAGAIDVCVPLAEGDLADVPS